MFILSQDKMKLVSIQNADIHIRSTGKVYSIYKNQELLGRYNIEERAKEIIMEIVKQLENIESFEQRYEDGSVIKIEKSQVVFKIPKE